MWVPQIKKLYNSQRLCKIVNLMVKVGKLSIYLFRIEIAYKFDYKFQVLQILTNCWNCSYHVYIIYIVILHKVNMSMRVIWAAHPYAHLSTKEPSWDACTINHNKAKKEKMFPVVHPNTAMRDAVFHFCFYQYTIFSSIEQENIHTQTIILLGSYPFWYFFCK